MSNHVPFWIASDLLAHAHAYGIDLPGDFSAGMVRIVRDEQTRWLTEKREIDEQKRRNARRRTLAERFPWF